MSCRISVKFPGTPEQKAMAFQQASAAAANFNGVFNADGEEGNLSVKTPLGKFEANFKVEGDIINVEVTRKPILLSCERIQEEVEKFVANWYTKNSTPSV